ncbi:MAG: hypothetical protein PHU71_06690, partial [Candidatus Gracilibacteria bacterium]|nr:hypothetical protein [Candidatus Gracilibacteria bacterium]
GLIKEFFNAGGAEDAEKSREELGFIAKNNGIIKELFNARDAGKNNIRLRARYSTAEDAEKNKIR